MNDQQYAKPSVRTVAAEELISRLGPVSAGSGIRNEFDPLSGDDTSGSTSGS